MQSKIQKLIEEQQEAIIDLLTQWVAIESVKQPPEPGAPFGPALRRMLDKALADAADMGFTVRDWDGYVGDVTLGDCPEEETVAILAHIDVVPAGEGWSRPPFGALLEDGRLYARGAIDDKGPMVAVLYAMRAVKEAGLPLKRPVRHIIGADEECDFRCVEYYLRHESQPAFGFVPDADFPLVFAEKGISHFRVFRSPAAPAEDGDLELLSLRGGSVVNAVPAQAAARLKVNSTGRAGLERALAAFAQKERLSLRWEGETLKISAEGRAAHASVPEDGLNAVALLLNFLNGLTIVPAEAALFIRALYQLFGGESSGFGAGVAASDEMSGPLTLSLDLIEMGEGKAEAKLDMRYPVTAEFPALWQKLKAACAAQGLQAEAEQHKEPLFTERESPLARTLLRVYREITGDASPPLAVGGGTYSRAMKNFVAFGPLFPGKEKRAHRADEYIETEELLLLTKIYAEAIYQLAGEECM